MPDAACRARPVKLGQLVAVPVLVGLTMGTAPAWAAGGEEAAAVGRTLFLVAVLVVAAKMGGLLAERLGQPAVLGELLVGVGVGNLWPLLAGGAGVDVRRGGGHGARHDVRRASRAPMAAGAGEAVSQARHLLGHVARLLEADQWARKRREPRLVLPPAPHVLAAVVVAGGPDHERLVDGVHRPARGQRLRAEALPLALQEAGEPDVGANEQEDHEVEARDEDVAPAAERAREHPARMRIQGGAEHLHPRHRLARDLERRVGGRPVVVVRVEVDVAVGLRDRGAERRRSRARGPEDVDAIRCRRRHAPSVRAVANPRS